MPTKIDFDGIYDAVKPLLEKHVPPFVVIRDDGKRYELSSVKPVEIWGKKRPGVYFAAVMKKKNFVGFYLMTIYAQPGLVQDLGPELKKCLKGKSCFHITKADPVILKQIKKALVDGQRCYKKLGWV
jgi:hypothetical protein